METGKEKNKNFYELKAVKKDPRAVGIVLLKNLNMVGRSINCDLCINIKSVSNIHAVVEIKGDKGLVYDMNSSEGTTINGKKITGSSSFVEGDILAFGGVEFTFLKYESKRDSKYKLDILSPEKEEILFPEKTARKKNQQVQADIETKTKDGEELPFLVQGSDQAEVDLPFTKDGQLNIPDIVEDTVPRKPRKPQNVSYPLAKDPQADFNEYIFEDINEVHPIFDYKPKEICVEVIILYHDTLISVDYISNSDGEYFLSGYQPKENEVEYPPIGKQKRLQLLTIKQGEVEVHPLEGFMVLFLQDEESRVMDTKAKEENDKIHLKNSGIVRFHQDDIQIYIRMVGAPPEVTPPPFLRKDPLFLKKYVQPVMAAAFLIFLLAMLVEVKEEEKKEKDQKRLAKILKPRIKKETKKKTTKTVSQKADKKVQKDASKTKAPTKEKKKVITKKAAKPRKKPTKVMAKKGSKKPSKSKTKKKVKKVVQAYKPINFKSSIKNLLNKGRAASKARVQATNSNLDIMKGGSFAGKGSVDKVKTANIDTKVGSLEGAAAGRLDSSISAKGLARKGDTMIADIPTKTIVKGSIDPQIILNLLREHLPQFRHCYQVELERGSKERFEGSVKLDFRIGASGHVTRANAASKARSRKFNGCIRKILKGIRFPMPKGGGVVDVKQSINFNIGG